MRVCGATEGVRPVKRKGSDQRRDEAMEEAGGDWEEWEVQSEPQDLCSTLQLYCFLGTLW